MAVRFGVIFITDNYTIDSVSQISQYQMKYHNFLQTLKIQKSPMKKFHFRHQKIIHHYIKYMDILKEK